MNTPHERKLGHHYRFDPRRGIDSDFVRAASRRFLSGDNPVIRGTGPNRDAYYLPQNLVLFAPVAFLPASVYYYSLITVSFLGILLLCFMSARALGLSDGAAFHVLILPSFLLLSYCGLFSFERGNQALVASLFVLLGFYCLVSERDLWASVFLSLSACVKPMYVPLAALLLLLPRRRKQALGIYVGIHLFLLALVLALNRDPALFSTYFSVWRGSVAYASGSFGGANVSFLSLFMVTGQTLGMELPAAAFMNMSASACVLCLLLGIAWALMREDLKKGATREKILWLFGFLLYVTVSWQFLSAAYVCPILVALFVLCDHWWRQGLPSLDRKLLLAHGVMLGMMFSPPEASFPLIRTYRGLYFLAGFVLYTVLWARRLRRSPS